MHSELSINRKEWLQSIPNVLDICMISVLSSFIFGCLVTWKKCKVKPNGLESHPQPKRNGFPPDKLNDRLFRIAFILPRWVVYETVYILCRFNIF